jgi:hypothetical protein
MVGAYAEYAQQFLFVWAIATTLFFAVPISLTPLAWAKMMRFKIPSDTDLTVYFGRCLGAFALVIEGMAFRAAFTGVAILFVFQVFLAFSVLMVFVHVYGAVKRIQPITETVEIALWVLFVFLYLAFFPVASAP